jgi:hypothetical protein
MKIKVCVGTKEKIIECVGSEIIDGILVYYGKAKDGSPMVEGAIKLWDFFQVIPEKAKEQEGK